MFTITARAGTAERVGRCAGRARYGESGERGSNADADKFTINVPGLTDILRIPGLDSPELRRERSRRFRQSRSPLPEVLQPLVRILNVLDDAQDLLFTGLALAYPLLKLVGPRIVPALGWALLVNDLLNAGT
jgi:hypothetical protein